ncbi:TPA: hypothetical protein DEO28_04480 [Candidatus Dependentiae bacterium]|nr:MAG: hypothetical protein UR14_C0002G0014 [candidate division TM6 bacterium GW2011_GWE2_31_21]KKP53811.1 MAG: hypothetical protein UR43_C0002G0014 [candidate division TM6 bacterium GW2011_GWF2_33_332]HBS47591.1 hypothetical protein [Candidatus Dependentiae bacterium]HBZ73740.1 hypothetical protein [Candidatus Dependentiae bacterium]
MKKFLTVLGLSLNIFSFTNVNAGWFESYMGPVFISDANVNNICTRIHALAGRFPHVCDDLYRTILEFPHELSESSKGILRSMCFLDMYDKILPCVHIVIFAITRRDKEGKLYFVEPKRCSKKDIQLSRKMETFELDMRIRGYF